MAGLLVLAGTITTFVALVTAWCVLEVATTDAYLLEVDGRCKVGWLLVALVPLLGPACWIELGRPSNEAVGPLAPRRSVHRD